MGDLVRQANTIVDAQDMGLVLADLRDYYLKNAALTSMAIYKEYIEVGFTEAQALDVAKAYMLEYCRLEFIED